MVTKCVPYSQTNSDSINCAPRSLQDLKRDKEIKRSSGQLLYQMRMIPILHQILSLNQLIFYIILQTVQDFLIACIRATQTCAYRLRVHLPAL